MCSYIVQNLFSNRVNKPTDIYIMITFTLLGMQQARAFQLVMRSNGNSEFQILKYTQTIIHMNMILDMNMFENVFEFLPGSDVPLCITVNLLFLVFRMWFSMYLRSSNIQRRLHFKL